MSEIYKSLPIQDYGFGAYEGLTGVSKAFEQLYTSSLDSITALTRASDILNSGFLESAKLLQKTLFSDAVLDQTVRFNQALNTGIQQFVKNNASALDGIMAFSLAFQSQAVEAVKALHRSGILEATAQAQTILANGIAQSLISINQSGILEMASQIQNHPEMFSDLLSTFDADGQIENTPAFEVVWEWVDENLKDVHNQAVKRILAFIILLFLGDRVTEMVKENLIRPNVCSTRVGCNLREQGIKGSKKILAIPYNTEVLVTEKRGRWKKISWEKESGDVYEGWIYCSLLKWKYSP